MTEFVPCPTCRHHVYIKAPCHICITGLVWGEPEEESNIV